MYINAVNGSYAANNKYPRQQFTGLIKDKSVAPILDKMSQNDILELNKIEKRLSRTRFWDMKISRIGNVFEELKFEFIDKINKRGCITDGIFPYEKEGNTIKIYSIIYGPKNISKNVVEKLRYKSGSRASTVYNKYLKNLEFVRHRSCNMTPLERIKSKEIELNMLEEASHFAEESDKLEIISTGVLTKDGIGNGIM